MAVALNGVCTVIYPSPDFDAAKAWWRAFFGAGPYFDQPFYVGYNVAGYEVGLLPSEDLADGALIYWFVSPERGLVERRSDPSASARIVGRRPTTSR